MTSSPSAPRGQVRIEVRTGERQLLIDGKAAKLGARAFDVLQALYERRERLVTKNELFELVWPGVVVEENNLQVQISTLRKLLGPGTIATIPGRGYQFTGADAAAGSRAARDAHVEHIDASASSATTPVGNLPDELPPLIARDGDLAALHALVAQHRLVSVVGAAGIGKTVLAQALAHDQRPAFDDGAWLIELAPISDAALLVPTVAAPLGLQLGADATAQDLAERLRGARCLLVLDNCEHLLPAVAGLVQTLLGRASGVRFVITAQEPLKISAENVYRLDVLGLPDESNLTSARAAGAVALFEARARAADPRFVLSEHSVSTVIDICRHLDGLPLAIELAAARVPMLGIDGLHARLGERLRLLTAGHRLALRRHQTLRAALEWSHGLLTHAEKAVFRRLGVFVGSFDLERAQQVGAGGGLDEWSVLDQLAALVDKSLVMAQPGVLPRYRLLESGRAYALEKLQEAGETEGAMERHIEAMRALFEQGDALRWRIPDDVLRDRYVADLDNLRAALDWAARGGADADALIALTGASWWIWAGAAALPEGQRRCALAMSRIDTTTAKPNAARLLLGYTMAAHPRASAIELDALERGIALCRELGDRRGLYFGLTQAVFRFSKVGRSDAAWRAVDEAQALQSDDLPPGLLPGLMAPLAHLHAGRGDYDTAAALKLAALRAYERLGDEIQVRLARDNLADMALARGDVQEAVRLGRENAAALRRGPRSHLYICAACFANLSAALTRAGELGEAQQMAREAIPLLQRRGWTYLHLDVFALLALKLGRPADAARALGRSRAVLGASGDAREINEQRAHDDALAGLREAFIPDELERLFAEGAVLSDEEAARTAADGCAARAGPQ
jgi:predicted ATPase/DNA-binding winged helix-turn-helix (wHTH) protein